MERSSPNRKVNEPVNQRALLDGYIVKKKIAKALKRNSNPPTPRRKRRIM
jgi:hypothetical protein